MLLILISMHGFSISLTDNMHHTKRGSFTGAPFLKEVNMAKKKVKEVPEQVRIYDGENINDISLEMTGSRHKVFALLNYSGLSLSSLKKGDILKWMLTR